jgi:hypothetical protein
MRRWEHTAHTQIPLQGIVISLADKTPSPPFTGAKYES